MWLRQLGAEVHGYALKPPTVPSLFDVAGLERCLATDTRADVTDLAAIRSAFQDIRPEVVFHLAAQPLVRESYKHPLDTLTTNIMGTAHVLEAARSFTPACAMVLITTDKVYQMRKTGAPFREDDLLGGEDPYSASKAAAEIVVASYRSSFFRADTGAAIGHVATARSGNVIGGGDWADDRLIPDCLRAFEQGKSVWLRYPKAIRPWQHVLEPLSGYLVLAERLSNHEAEQYATAWNFGPEVSDAATVENVARITARLWGGDARVDVDLEARHPHEAELLRLDISRARERLGWRPRWPLALALKHTVEWYKAWAEGREMLEYSIAQIDNYQRDDSR